MSDNEGKYHRNSKSLLFIYLLSLFKDIVCIENVQIPVFPFVHVKKLWETLYYIVKNTYLNLEDSYTPF